MVIIVYFVDKTNNINHLNKINQFNLLFVYDAGYC